MNKFLLPVAKSILRTGAALILANIANSYVKDTSKEALERISQTINYAKSVMQERRAAKSN